MQTYFKRSDKNQNKGKLNNTFICNQYLASLFPIQSLNDFELQNLFLIESEEMKQLNKLKGVSNPNFRPFSFEF